MASHPQRIGEIVTDLLARRGLTRVLAASQWENAWREAAGELAARHSRVGALRRGKLEVTVVNSLLLQELNFRKAALVRALAARLPDAQIKDLRFRLGAVE